LCYNINVSVKKGSSSNTFNTLSLEWATRPPSNGIPLEVAEPNDFYRLFSALNFLFCIHEEDPIVDEEMVELAKTTGIPIDEFVLTDEQVIERGAWNIVKPTTNATQHIHT